MIQVSKYAIYKDLIIELAEINNYSARAVSRQLAYQLGRKTESGALRRYVTSVIQKLPRKREFIETQRRLNESGKVTSSVEKLQSEPVEIPDNHEIVRLSTNKTTGQQWIITKPKEETLATDGFDYFGEIEKLLDSYKPRLSFDLPKLKKEGVATITDLHFGAYVSAMKMTPEYNITILCNMLSEAANTINRFGYTKVHIHVLGDLIESFTGLNHKNSWKGLGKGMFGVKAITLFTKLFSEHFLERVTNLGTIKMIAGNHDRTTSDNNEDVDGEAAEAIAWGLGLMGYDIEFNPAVITHVVDDVCYILNHGHHPFTMKKTTKDMCWDYGVKGMFNFITEGHLHSRIKKLDAKQVKNFQMVSDDNIDCRRQVCPSLFTGNTYSEYGGWSTTAGFIISETNATRKGVNVFDFSF